MNDKSEKGRVREAKGSVQEAIGKLIGDVQVEQQGASESKAGAREADAADAVPESKPKPKPKPGKPRAKVSPKSDPVARTKSGPAAKDLGDEAPGDTDSSD